MNGVEGFMYPNEIGLQWSVLIVLYPFITGLVAGAFILASLERVFRVEAVKPTYRLALLTALVVPACCAAAAAVAPRPSGALAGDVLHAAQHFGDGDVRLCVPVVPDGRAGVRDLARLPARYRAAVAVKQGPAAADLQGDDAGLRATSARARCRSTSGSAGLSR